MIKTLKRTIKNLLKPYRAVIVDEDGDRWEHRAMTTQEARGWLRCYGRGVGIIYTRTGRMVAVRIA